MRLAAVSQRVDFIAERDERRDALDQRLAAWLLAANVLTVPVPNGLRQGLGAWLEAVQPDLVVISGGNDIGTAAERDDTERELLDWAERLHRPALGICRGMQMMAVRAGGALREVKNHVRQRHGLHPEPGAGADWPLEVNSFHGHGLHGCPPDFEVQAHADDGSIEAIRHRLLPWEAWMWHPEREVGGGDIEARRLRALLRDSLANPERGQ